jgi:hypothetical protein
MTGARVGFAVFILSAPMDDDTRIEDLDIALSELQVLLADAGDL